MQGVSQVATTSGVASLTGWALGGINGLIKIPAILSSLGQLYNTNPFGRAFEEAISVGNYLGFILGRLNVLGYC